MADSLSAQLALFAVSAGEIALAGFVVVIVAAALALMGDILNRRGW